MEKFKRIAKEIRRDVIEMIWLAGGGHIGGSLSIVEILTVLYFKILKINTKFVKWEDRDRFILSKGHSSASLYSVLARRGYFPKERLFDSFITINGMLQEHPDMNKVPGIEISSGSLGQGLSAGIGMAWGLKNKNKKSRVYVLLGDGELNEGQVWEAAMASSKLDLNNLTAIVDYNKFGVCGHISKLMPISPLSDKWKAFGWLSKEIDGHDINALIKAFQWAKVQKKPQVIIANTIKAKGISFMENKYEFHACSLTEEQYKNTLRELK